MLDLKFPTHKEQKILKQSLTGVFHNELFDRKSLLKFSSAGNVVRTLKKHSQTSLFLVHF